jgi:hypothetical protein
VPPTFPYRNRSRQVMVQREPAKSEKRCVFRSLRTRVDASWEHSTLFLRPVAPSPPSDVEETLLLGRVFGYPAFGTCKRMKTASFTGTPEP